MTHPPARDGFVLVVPFTLVLTQEDGRTAFAQGQFGVDQANRVLSAGIGNADAAFDVFVFFSDRQRFAGNSDRMGLELFETVGGGSLTLRSTLKSWGNAIQVLELALPANYQQLGRIYVGYGTSIANGRGQAINALTLNDLQETEIVLL